MSIGLKRLIFAIFLFHLTSPKLNPLKTAFTNHTKKSFTRVRKSHYNNLLQKSPQLISNERILSETDFIKLFTTPARPETHKTNSAHIYRFNTNFDYKIFPLLSDKKLIAIANGVKIDYINPRWYSSYILTYDLTQKKELEPIFYTTKPRYRKLQEIFVNKSGILFTIFTEIENYWFKNFPTTVLGTYLTHLTGKNLESLSFQEQNFKITDDKFQISGDDDWSKR